MFCRRIKLRFQGSQQFTSERSSTGIERNSRVKKVFRSSWWKGTHGVLEKPWALGYWTSVPLCCDSTLDAFGLLSFKLLNGEKSMAGEDWRSTDFLVVFHQARTCKQMVGYRPRNKSHLIDLPWALWSAVTPHVYLGIYF